MGYRERVHPHAPAPPLVLDCVVEENAKNVVHHLSNLLFIRVFRVYVAKREHPILPYGALKQAPSKDNKTILIEALRKLL